MTSTRSGQRSTGEHRDTRRPAEGHRFCTPTVRETPIQASGVYGSAW